MYVCMYVCMYACMCVLYIYIYTHHGTYNSKHELTQHTLLYHIIRIYPSIFIGWYKHNFNNQQFIFSLDTN